MFQASHADVAILTDERYEQVESPDWYEAQILNEEEMIVAALKDVGLSAVRVAWSNPRIQWDRMRCAVFRSTWDYYTRFQEFSAWTTRASALTHLINSESLIRWNWDKHYLADIARRDIAIPPTRFIEPGSVTTLTAEFAQSGWSQAILKPAISGGARHTYRIDADSAADHEAMFSLLHHDQTLLVQEFLPSVQSEGEISLIVIDGTFTHAVRKMAKIGDFRVQDDHGGTVGPHDPSGEEVEFAERSVAACPEHPTYARVDLVRDRRGELSLMELELLEPELFLRFHPPAAQALARAIFKGFTKSGRA